MSKPRKPPPVAPPEPEPEVPVESPEQAKPTEPESDEDLVPIAAKIKRADSNRLRRHLERIQAERPMAIVGISEPIRVAIHHGLDAMDAQHPKGDDDDG